MGLRVCGSPPGLDFSRQQLMLMLGPHADVVFAATGLRVCASLSGLGYQQLFLLLDSVQLVFLHIGLTNLPGLDFSSSCWM